MKMKSATTIYKMTQLKRGMKIEEINTLKDELQEIEWNNTDFCQINNEKFDSGNGLQAPLKLLVFRAIEKLTVRAERA